MTKASRAEYEDRRMLQDAGWRVQQTDGVCFNGGSETQSHFLCKAHTAFVLRDRGYRVDSEVKKDGVGDIDIIAYGKADETPFAVECETKPDPKVISDKIDRYVTNEPYRECFVLDVDEMPSNHQDAIAWVRDNL